jgi:hypothetical protein
MSSVLLVGEDELLLQTRSAVVRTTGANTLCCASSAALAIQQERECDVVILCHTLPRDYCAALAEVIHARWPKTCVLLVSSTRIWEQPDAPEAMDAVSSADPEHLVGRTIELLGRRDPVTAKPPGRGVALRPDSPIQLKAS